MLAMIGLYLVNVNFGTQSYFSRAVFNTVITLESLDITHTPSGIQNVALAYRLNGLAVDDG